MILRACCYLVFLLCSLPYASGQWVVTSLADLPDSDLTDALFSPRTLRSAIQNANKAGVATTIQISAELEFKTIAIGSDLPVINVPTTFLGKGIVIEPTVGSAARFGLWFTANNCKIKEVKIRGFLGTGLVWQGSDGLIEKMIIANNGVGINMNNASRNVIGSTDHTGYYSNYIYGSQGTGGYGISMILNSDNNTVQYTAIGVNESYMKAPNSRSGIYTESKGGIFRQNLISGNESDGIQISGRRERLGTLVENNQIGTNVEGNDSIPNDGNGVSVFQSSGDIIRENLISGNDGNGIYIADRESFEITVTRNRVGLNRMHNDAIPNGSGIQINGNGHTIIGNIVSGNRYAGIGISSRNTILQNNIIGLDSTQKLIIGNGGPGLSASFMDSSIVGDVSLENPNIIAGNRGAGVSYGNATGIGARIVGNIIGTDASLKLNAPNAGSGIIVRYSVTQIDIEDNVIAYSGKHGIEIERNVVIFLDTTRPAILQRPHNILVAGNTIGYAETDADSAGFIGGSGISVLNADSIFIVDNAIYACAGDGITIANDSTWYVRMYLNDIGAVDKSKTKQIVKGHGIHVKGAQDVVIGWPSDTDSIPNSITHCEGFAIRVEGPATGMASYQSSTCDNLRGGIELDNSLLYYVFASSDERDADVGTNGYQNTPELAFGRVKDGQARIAGWLNAVPGQTYRIDVYLDRERGVNERTLNQGCVRAGWYSKVAGASGVIVIDTMWTHPKLATFGVEYPMVVLTATSIDGTSQFSLPPTAPPDDTAGVDIAVIIDTTKSRVDPDGTAHLYASIANLGFGLATNVVVTDSLLGAFAVDSATIERGVVSIMPERVVATIASLSKGQRAKYHAVGRATQLGAHRRAMVALPAQSDARLKNNHDTILLSASTVNSVAGNPNTNVRIDGRDGHVRIVSLVGVVAASIEDITGRTVAIGNGERFELRCVPGVYLVRVVSSTNSVSHQLVLVE